MQSGNELITLIQGHGSYKVMDSKVKVTDNIFKKMHFSGRGVRLKHRHKEMQMCYSFSFWVTLSPFPYQGGVPLYPGGITNHISRPIVGSTNFITLPAPLRYD